MFYGKMMLNNINLKYICDRVFINIFIMVIFFSIVEIYKIIFKV